MIPASVGSASPSSIYLLSSDEPLMLREWLDQARRQLHQNRQLEMRSETVESGFDFDALTADLGSLSLFSDSQCVVLHFASTRIGKKAADWISGISGSPSDNILILVMPRLDRAAKKTAWFKSLSGHAEICELAAVAREKLPQWLQQRARQKGKTLDQQAALLLAEMTEGNLLASDQELEKLCLAYPDEKDLQLSQVQQALARSARYSHYLLVDACLEGQTKRALRVLLTLQQEGVSTVQIQFALQSTIEALIELKLAEQSGRLTSQIWQKLRIWNTRQGLYRNALRRFTSSGLERFLRQCAKLDRLNKGRQAAANEGDEWNLLNRMAVQLSGVKSEH